MNNWLTLNEDQQLNLSDLSFLPPEGFMERYRADYQEMQTNMIYRDSPDFDDLYKFLNSLKVQL
jgi:hypothetical protein